VKEEREDPEVSGLLGVAFPVEHGSSHVEALRSRDRAQRTARFIHHFTRFQAHGDSGSLEMKMHRDTISRIENSLQATGEGSLQWLQGIHVPIPIVDMNWKKTGFESTPSDRSTSLSTPTSSKTGTC
jgi:hypothetical protein